MASNVWKLTRRQKRNCTKETSAVLYFIEIKHPLSVTYLYTFFSNTEIKLFIQFLIRPIENESLIRNIDGK